jgi:hypothetical protein
MKITDVIALVNAGFSKSEISAMISAETPAPKPEAPTPKPEAPTQKPEAPAPAQEAPAQKPEAPSLDLSGLNTAIDTLTKKIQNINLSAAELPEPESIQKKADDILASIINPPRAGK